MIQLPGYGCSLEEDSVLHSSEKAKSAAADLEIIGIPRENITTLPCESFEETINYRCSCTFQIVIGDSGDLQYSMRSAKEAVPLGGDYFPIATKRIQHNMKKVMQNLNKKDGEGNYTFNVMRRNLSSISFASSWNDDLDCIVTMNFCKPIYECEESKKVILNTADNFCKVSEITSLILRSKKVKEIVGRTPIFIDDVINIQTSESNDILNISLGRGDVNDKNTTPIFYRKSEDAFQHPNSNTMLQALKWMLNKLNEIKAQSGYSDGVRFRLLEMYCGCGAHTMAIAKSNIFDTIVAVELDQRLVQACQSNCEQNSCSPKDENDDDKSTSVYVFQGDATEWAAKSLLRTRKEIEGTIYTASKSSKSYWYTQQYNVLLVDPPRQGLSKEVCDLAANSSFEHMLYISCGRDALKADLQVLSTHFEVVDCTITDLFPRTTSVETLVHLRRRKVVQ